MHSCSAFLSFYLQLTRLKINISDPPSPLLPAVKLNKGFNATLQSYLPCSTYSPVSYPPKHSLTIHMGVIVQSLSGRDQIFFFYFSCHFFSTHESGGMAENAGNHSSSFSRIILEHLSQSSSRSLWNLGGRGFIY